jgi:hypothetical protein
MLLASRNWLLSQLAALVSVKRHAAGPSCPSPASSDDDIDPSVLLWSGFSSAVADTRAKQTLNHFRQDQLSRRDDDDDDPALNPDLPWPEDNALDSPVSVATTIHPDELSAAVSRELKTATAVKWPSLDAAVTAKHEAPDVLAEKQAKMREAAALEEWKQTAAAAQAKEEAEIAEWRRQAEQVKAWEAETWKRQVAAAKAEEADKLDEWRAAAAKAKAEALM